MRFDVTIFADSPAELQDMFQEIADAIPSNVFDVPGRGFKIFVTPDPMSSYDLTLGDTLGVPTPSIPPLKPEAEAEPEPPKRTRRTRAQIDADEAAAAAAAAARASTTNGAAPTTMSASEAKLKALDILRECYTMEGGPSRIKDVQRKFSVAKFIDVPDVRGDELYACALTLKNELMPV